VSPSPYPAPHLPLHSFPTRRSSDLSDGIPRAIALLSPRRLLTHRQQLVQAGELPGVQEQTLHLQLALEELAVDGTAFLGRDVGRSEEHTSELQSRGHLVCRLLLEKK